MTPPERPTTPARAGPGRSLPVLSAPSNGAGGGCGGASGAGHAAGAGCHGGRETLRAAAAAAGKADTLTSLAADYPVGPHDQPQSMCPAFGSLRVGLRMRRTATILSGSACCVYGLTFTSHFYGARRTVGYVPFNSETLVTGELFEDIKRAVEEVADPERYDCVVVTNLCVPTASGVPLDLLPDEINGVRIVGIDVPGFGVPTHAEAKDVLAGALLRVARREAAAGPVARPSGHQSDRPRVTLLGELFPADPMVIATLLEPMGAAVGSAVPTRAWRELYGALDCSVAAALHPFYTASVRELREAGRPVVGSGPVGVEGTAAWLERIGDAVGAQPARIATARGAGADAARAALDRTPLSGRITLAGYEGSELLVARLLVEAGAEVPYVGTACPRTEWSEADRDWLEAHGAHVEYRATLERDVEAFREAEPDLVIGTTPVVQAAKESGTPALYFTNLISARPIFGPAGAGALSRTIQTAMEGRERLRRMRAFFEGVGVGAGAGYGHAGVPEARLSAVERNARARGGTARTGTDPDRNGGGVAAGAAAAAGKGTAC
ncbi:MAG: chlorophyllide a reductase subunit Y [Gemmatimonadota bacterium]